MREVRKMNKRIRKFKRKNGNQRKIKINEKETKRKSTAEKRKKKEKSVKKRADTHGFWFLLFHVDEEEVVGFSSASVFPARKREAITQGGNI